MSYKVVLLRHGESVWNVDNRFTGWTDVELSDKGRAEAACAGALLSAAGVLPTSVHTSLLRRAIHTSQLALQGCDRDWVATHRTWRLNERHYGALQGLNKRETAQRHSDEQVFVWRRSYSVPPPPLALDDPRHPRHDIRYAMLAPEQLPDTECLHDVVVRVLPYWHDVIVPELRAGGLPLVVAHGNSLRAIVKHLDRISDADIAELNIPTGTPWVFELDESFRPLRSAYLGDAAEIAAAKASVAAQGKGQ